MKVLVTGASGLLGSELCSQLKQRGLTIHGVDNLSRSSQSTINLSCDRFFNLDLTDVKSFDKIDKDYSIVFHYAAINGTNSFYERPNGVLRNNTLLDFNIIDFANSLRFKPLLVYASSSEVVADSSSNKLKEYVDININDITNPRWSYRLAKISGENYLSNSGLQYLILRYFNVYGSDSRPGHFVADQIEKICNGIFTIIGATETRSFCHVKDAIDASVYCSFNVCNKIINIGNDSETRIEDAANIIARNQGIDPKDADWEYIKSRKGSVKKRLPTISRLRKIYPEYSPMSFEEGIKYSFPNED